MSIEPICFVMLLFKSHRENLSDHFLVTKPIQLLRFCMQYVEISKLSRRIDLIVKIFYGFKNETGISHSHVNLLTTVSMLACKA